MRSAQRWLPSRQRRRFGHRRLMGAGHGRGRRCGGSRICPNFSHSHDMVLCKRRGCGQEFELESPQGPCRYHPGGPVFHEGLKFWSCCKDTNKPCVEFDDFVKLPGCTTQEAHTNEKQAPPPTQQVGGRVVDADEAAAAAAAAQHKPVPTGPAPAQPVAAPVTPAAPAAPAPEPRDADSVVSISRGTACKRPGCGYVADADIAQRDRRAEQCKYHKGSAIFHEGSKGWSCCKRRVLDFDDFLEIAPCTAAEHGHLFTEAKTDNERVQCRIDHYETPNDVHVTVYAKGVEPERSQIELRDNEVSLLKYSNHRLCLPCN